MRRGTMPYWFATHFPARRWWAPGGLRSSLPARSSRWSTTSSSASTCWAPVTAPRGPVPSIPRQAKSTGRIFLWSAVRDNVRAQARLLDSLGIRKLAAGAGRVHRRHAGAGLDHPSSRPRGARPHHRRHAAFGHGAGAQPPAAPGHPARSGVGRRALSAAAPAAPRAGAGPPDRHDQLQIRAALRRALRPQSTTAAAKIPGRRMATAAA